MGELQLRVWLEGEHPTDAQAKAADSAASSWAGDRIGLYEGPSGAWAVVLRTQWRSASGRTAFVAAANQTLDGLSSPSAVCGDATPRGHLHRLGRDRPRELHHLPAGGVRAGAARPAPPRGAVWPPHGRSGAPPSGGRRYIDSGAEMPSRPSALARVVFVAATRARRAAERSGSSASTTRASR